MEEFLAKLLAQALIALAELTIMWLLRRWLVAFAELTSVSLLRHWRMALRPAAG